MAELSISAAVGESPALNLNADVRIVQKLLSKVTPPLRTAVAETGTVDAATKNAIREFQKRFMSNPDGRVDPDGRTIWHLNDGFVSKYIGCSATQRRDLDRDIITAQKWLDQAIRRLATPDADAKNKLKNVFHVDADSRADGPRLVTLRANFRRLRDALDQSFPLKCEGRPSVFGAWVVLSDTTGTMHFPPNHFSNTPFERIMRVIHERAHTIFQIGHDGMPAGGAVDFGTAPDDDNGFTHDQAMGNAYCYGWLAAALQPDYVRPDEGEVITAGSR
jgi:hypothetical protein